MMQGYRLAASLGHTFVEPNPSLFTFAVAEAALTALHGVSVQEVRATLEISDSKGVDSKLKSKLTQTGPLLVTHWGLSGPVVLRLSAWAARHLFATSYNATLVVDFAPRIQYEALGELLIRHKEKHARRKLGACAPTELLLPRRLWCYLLERQGQQRVATDYALHMQGLALDQQWAGVSSKALRILCMAIKRCSFLISGKGEFKDEFVTAGGVPLAEVDLASMESKQCAGLFFAGEVLNVDGVTGGFNFQVCSTSISETNDTQKRFLLSGNPEASGS
eukprot:SM000010S04318  [mRNA]  locus=s10:932021:934497:+ [translate_table: standard]